MSHLHHRHQTRSLIPGSFSLHLSFIAAASETDTFTLLQLYRLAFPTRFPTHPLDRHITAHPHCILESILSPSTYSKRHPRQAENCPRAFEVTVWVLHSLFELDTTFTDLKQAPPPSKISPCSTATICRPCLSVQGQMAHLVLRGMAPTSVDQLHNRRDPVPTHRWEVIRISRRKHTLFLNVHRSDGPLNKAAAR